MPLLLAAAPTRHSSRHDSAGALRPRDETRLLTPPAAALARRGATTSLSDGGVELSQAEHASAAPQAIEDICNRYTLMLMPRARSPRLSTITAEPEAKQFLRVI